MAQLQKMGIARSEVLEKTGSQKWMGLGSSTVSVSLRTPFSFRSMVWSRHRQDPGAKTAGQALVWAVHPRSRPHVSILPASCISGSRASKALAESPDVLLVPGGCTGHSPQSCDFCCIIAQSLASCFPALLPPVSMNQHRGCQDMGL